MKKWINRNDETYQKVIKILNTYDLEDLIRLGSPKDEYEPEALDILNRCYNCQPIETISKNILEIFNHWFSNSNYDNEKIDNMAKDLQNIL
jgi:hypothetical protein